MNGKEFLEDYDPQIKEVGYNNYSYTPDQVIQRLNAFKKQLRSNNVINRFSDPNFIDNVCISYRNDFGLLNKGFQYKLRFDCKQWMRAIKNNYI